MKNQGMYLMQDIVLNHTSQKHEWAVKARNGEKKISGLFLFF
jgi:amylosucrase